MVLFKRLVRYFFAFIIISVILTELILRVIFYFGFVPMGLQTVDGVFHNTETIEFRGEVLPDIHASGTKVARRGYPYVINEYSGFREGFDFSKKAIRFLTIGASYVNGCCLVDQDEFLFNNLSARKLAENLGVGVQFADSSWNNNARFFNNYIIYGSKVLEKGVKHDYAIIEVSYDVLAHPEHERPMTIEEYQNDKELPEDRQSISKMIKRSFLSDLYFVRLSFTIAGIFKWYKPRLEQLVPFNKAERIKQDEWMKKLYRSDRPYYDDKKLSNLEPTKIRKAYEENKLIMKDSFIYWICD